MQPRAQELHQEEPPSRAVDHVKPSEKDPQKSTR